MVKYNKAIVGEVQFENYADSIKKVLDLIKVNELISNEKRIILKPNLTINKKPPVTTDVRCVEEIMRAGDKLPKNARINPKILFSN